jgi:hypothetical protein
VNFVVQPSQAIFPCGAGVYRPDHKGVKYRIAFAEDLPKVCYFKAAAPSYEGNSAALIFSVPYYRKGSHPENKSRNFIMDDWLEFLG